MHSDFVWYAALTATGSNKAGKSLGMRHAKCSLRVESLRANLDFVKSTSIYNATLLYQ